MIRIKKHAQENLNRERERVRDGSRKKKSRHMTFDESFWNGLYKHTTTSDEHAWKDGISDGNG